MTPENDATGPENRDSGRESGDSRRESGNSGRKSGVSEREGQREGRESKSESNIEPESGTEAKSETEGKSGAESVQSADVADQLSVPLETLAVLNWLGDTAISGVESRINDVVSDDLTVTTEQVKIGYAEQETLASQFHTDQRAGARVLLSKPLVGNVLVVFPMESANKAAALMLQRAVEDLSSVSTEMGRDALTELCNMMANGFVDEWASLFETTIDTGSPVALADPERTLVARILKQYEVGLFIRSRIRIPDHGIDATIYMFPGKEEFVTKISEVGLGVIE